MSNLIIIQKEECCKKLEVFTDNTDKYLREICSYLNWDFDKISKKDQFITCPFNEAHRVPQRTVEKHLKNCEWNILGYTKKCIPLSEPSLPLKSPSTIKFDMQLQHNILQTAKQKYPDLNIGVDEKLIPQTSDRLLSDFTNDERKAMYEYVISNTIAPDIGQDITDINKTKKINQQSTPIIELLAQERNLKRRRTKHRGVHTNKKSHIEILRELVQEQMEIFKEHILEKSQIITSNNVKEYNYCYKNNKNENKEKKRNENERWKSEIDTNDVSRNFILKYSEKNLMENKQFHNSRHKNNSKDYNEESKKKAKSNKDYNTYCKPLYHYKTYDNKNSSKDQYSQNSLLKRDYYNKEHGKYEFDDKGNHQYMTQHKIYFKSDVSDKNHDLLNVRNCKRDRSKSSERKYEKSQYVSKQQRNDKKHKKSFKKKKKRCSDDKDDCKHKNSSYKCDKKKPQDI